MVDIEVLDREYRNHYSACFATSIEQLTIKTILKYLVENARKDPQSLTNPETQTQATPETPDSPQVEVQSK